MSSRLISESGWRPSRVTTSSSGNRAPACAPARTISTPISFGRSPTGTTRSSSGPGASCSGSTAFKVIVRSSSESSGEPQLEQNVLVGGLRCPHWLQNTYVPMSALRQRSIGLGVHQRVELAGLADLDPADPTRAVGIAVEQFRLALERRVDLGDRPGDGRIDVTDRLRALDLAERLARRDGATGVRHLDEHHVAERVLGVLGDADGHRTALDTHPLVIGGVAEFGGDVHGITVPAITSRR